MKRFFIISALLLTFLVTSLALFVYFFNVNDYSEWIAKQIEKSTGYQVSFVLIENNGWQDPRFSVSGLSVISDKKELLHIDQINIDIGQWDIWNRQLEIELVDVAGIHIRVEQGILKGVTAGQKSVGKTKRQMQSLPWDRLRINKLRVSDLNMDLSNAGQSLKLQQANLSSDNLPIIEHKKFVSALFKGNLLFDFKKLDLQLSALKAVRLEDLSLYCNFDLQSLQAKLALSIKQLGFTSPNQAEIIVENSLLDLQLHKNRLSLKRLFIKAFSGELDLQADALLSIHLIPAPTFSVNSLTVLSLLVKDMSLNIPAFMQASENEEFSRTNEKQKLPLETLFLKQVNLQNLNISSEEKLLPLTVKGLNSRVSEFYLLQNNQLFSLSAENNQSGLFALQFTYLQWSETIVEQFSVAGSFSEDAARLLLLKQLITDN